jgi:hypothetical protein
VNRALLVVALAFSLWPIGAILVLVGEGERTPTTPQTPVIGNSGKASSVRPQLEALTSRALHLDTRFAGVELHVGESRMEFSYTAWSIEEDLRRWLSKGRSVSSRYEIAVARKTISLLRSLGRLAEEPTERRLRTYNRAVATFDGLVK